MQFLENMLTLNPKDYGSADIPIGIILLGFAVGMILATVISQMVNAVVYRVIKALTRHKCIYEASAKALKSLGLSEDRWVQRFLKRENPILLRDLCTAQEPSSRAEQKSVNATVSDEIADLEAVTVEATTAQAAEEKETRYYLNPKNSDRAKELLREGLSVEGCAEEVGFSTANYFSKVFRRECGTSPSEFIKTI